MANILVSKNRLQEYIKDKLPEDSILEEKLTMHIFEVEGRETVSLEGVVRSGNFVEEEMLTTDTVFDIKVLPDRSGYCFSHRYVAQELAAILKSKYIAPKYERIDGESAPATVSMKIETPEINPLHLIRKISNINNSVESPIWLKNFLKAMGQRSINYIVDLTNFVMLDTGQPIHAFDADKVQGDLVVRYANTGEKITLLDGKEIELDPNILVIADDVNLLDITGIKGGKVAEVTNDTKNIILIAGHFNSTYIRKTSQKINLKNDSSKRFENAVTIERPQLAVDEFSALLRAGNGGEADNKNEQIIFEEIIKVGDDNIAGPKTLTVNPSYINERIGIQIDTNEMIEILKRLDFNPVEDGENIIIQIPQYRADILIQEDIADEIGRLHGYESLLGTMLPQEKNRPILPSYEYANRIRVALANELDFSEVYTYTLRERGDFELANPLNAERSHLRNSIGEMFPKVFEQNMRNMDLLALETIKIFEIGHVFKDKKEKLSLAIGVTTREGKKKAKVIEENMTEALQVIAQIFNTEIDKIKKVEIENEQGGKNSIFEVDLETLIDAAQSPSSEIPLVTSANQVVKFKKFSQYPYIVRDIAVFIPGPKGKSGELRNIIDSLDTDLIVNIYQFDEFEKVDSENGTVKTSYAFRIIFQSYERTLTDTEVEEVMQKLNSKITEQEGWEIR